MNEEEITELKAWREDARRGLEREVELLREKKEQIDEYLKALDATDGLLAEVEDLKGELENRQQEVEELTELLERKEAEIAELRRQLLEAKNWQLETEKVQLETEKVQLAAEVSAKPTEIHNHFESGSSAQVFNDRVTGRFGRKLNVKKNNKQKKEKKRWKKIARRIL